MLKQTILLILIGLILNLAFYTTKANTIDNGKEAKFAEKVKQSVAKLGVGKDSKVQVKLKDGTKLKGYISEISDEYYVVTNEKTGQTTIIPYPQTKQIKGSNYSGLTIAITIGFVILIIILGAASAG